MSGEDHIHATRFDGVTDLISQTQKSYKKRLPWGEEWQSPLLGQPHFTPVILSPWPPDLESSFLLHHHLILSCGSLTLAE